MIALRRTAVAWGKLLQSRKHTYAHVQRPLTRRLLYLSLAAAPFEEHFRIFCCTVLLSVHRFNGREYLKTIEESDMQWQHRKETSRRERNTAGGPTSPTRAAIHNGTFHSTGSMAFGSSVPASPSLHRQASTRSGNGSLIGSPSPRTKGSGGLNGTGGSGSGTGSGWGSGPLSLSASGGSRTGIGRTGSASSNSSMVSAGGGPVVDSRGGAGQQHGGGGGGEGARAAGAAGGAGAGVGGEGGRDPAAKSLPSTPQKNPLLMRSFTPSPTSKGSKQSRLPSTFASTGGSQ